MTERQPINGIQDPLWFREGSNGEKKGPFPLALVSTWYERSQLLPSVELSADDGKQWSSIVTLRRRNGPAFPISSFSKDPKGMGNIAIATEMVSSARSEIVQLENEMNFICEQLKEEENVLEKLKEMERDSEDDSLLVYTEEPVNEVQGRYSGPMSREEVIRVSNSMRSLLLRRNTCPHAETSEVFYPRFFCNQAFRLVAREESTALHEMNRVCAANSTTFNRASVQLDGPLAILARCDDPVKILRMDARTALKKFERFHACNRSKLLAATKDVAYKLRVNYDNFNHPSPVDRSLCGVNIGSPFALQKHVTSSKHITKIEILGTSVDLGAYKYWKKAINSTFVHIKVIRDESSVDDASNDTIGNLDETSQSVSAEKPHKSLSLDPSEVSFPATGGSTIVKIVSTSESRLAFKINTTNNQFYTVSRTSEFIDPKANFTLKIKRKPGPPKDNSLYVYWTEVPAEATDPKVTIAAGAQQGEVILRMKAV